MSRLILIFVVMLGAGCVPVVKHSTSESSPDRKPYPPLLPKGEGYAKPTQVQQLWALSTCAILTEVNHEKNDLLGGRKRTAVAVKAMQDTLEQWWNIRSREDLLDTLKWIEEGGHRREFDAMARDLTRATPEQIATIRLRVRVNPTLSNRVEVVIKYGKDFGRRSIAGWDYCRYIDLCGWSYIAGYLTEDEAWQRIMPAARVLQARFGSWEDLGKNYLAGREFWSLRQTQKLGSVMREIYQHLLTDPHSPWVSMPWDVDLTAPTQAR